ncbi:hypothetical protein HKD28_10660 [Gluconobacter sp. LMG 1744]|uniref:hypothetical protein n=1 Tax=Gluconobacter TaxID=441 RepID=UPI00188571F7|nr:MULTISPECIES: hypothetical protein [Gluconobacter]MBF0891862.1 hypothetical protein [Gluconobacter cadivus]MBS1075694.1 hypothetical protein [Gluconobacter sp. Dm-73]MBS1092475.1 hypothetical protein [Gluconobacter sp. Dm-74]
MSISVLSRSALSDLSLSEWQGQPTVQHYTTLLRLIDAAGPLPFSFAEPVVQWVVDDKPGQITWYGTVEHPFRPLTDYPPLQQDALLKNLTVCLQKLQRVASSHPQSYATLLEKALFVPNLKAVFTDGTQLILAPWGAQDATHRIDPALPDTFSRTPLGALLEPSSKNPDFLNTSAPQKGATASYPAQKADPFSGTTSVGTSFEARLHDESSIVTAPFPASSAPLPWLLPLWIRIILHVLTFTAFFALAFWAVLAFASHSKLITMFGHVMFGTHL